MEYKILSAVAIAMSTIVLACDVLGFVEIENVMSYATLFVAYAIYAEIMDMKDK